MTRRTDRLRLAGFALVAMLLCQTATSLLAHAHVDSVAGDAQVVGAAGPATPEPGSFDHGLLECRVCRLRGDLDRHATAWTTHGLDAAPGGASPSGPRTSAARRALWWPGSVPARAPPVLS